MFSEGQNDFETCPFEDILMTQKLLSTAQQKGLELMT
jgi:hypothetical protein